MACGACGSGGSFTPATYTVRSTDADGQVQEQTFLSKTQAVMFASRNGGGEIITNRGEARS
ncbi:hypothetical protein ACTQX1_08325 [Collinsella bouchesdurhonensis]|uniref:hypothetical protein n=1 Tax=Actinomycetota TaxID=201174 RepID=UPI003F8ADEBC